MPASALTNIGLFGNGRFYEGLLRKLNVSNLVELQDTGRLAYNELSNVIPSFVRRADLNHRNQKDFARFYESMNEELRVVAKQFTDFESTPHQFGVKLIDFNTSDVKKVAATLLYANSNKSLESLKEHCSQMSNEELTRIIDAACNSRENRRHKSPRALEQAFFTFEIVSDYGCYRDLHRHRMLTQERQFLTCDYHYFIPSEILETNLESPYRDAMEQSKKAYDTISKELPEEAQYVVPMAFNLPWYFHINLRALQWLCELRSSSAGHPNYRYIAQEMASQVSKAIPAFEPIFKFVDFEGHDALGRLKQEERKAEKLQQS